MTAPEIVWDPGRSNWHLHQRRYVRPFMEEALGEALKGLTTFNIETHVAKITVCRAVNTNYSFGATGDSETEFELFVRADDIQHRKLARLVNFFGQVIFHEFIHIWRNHYFHANTIRERAVSEGLAYGTTQQFAARAGVKDEFDAPIDYLKTLPAYELAAIRQEVVVADRQVGVVLEKDMKKENDFLYWVSRPIVGDYSAAEVVGICAVGEHFAKGKLPQDLITLPAEAVLGKGYETAA